MTDTKTTPKQDELVTVKVTASKVALAQCSAARGAIIKVTAKQAEAMIKAGEAEKFYTK